MKYETYKSPSNRTSLTVKQLLDEFFPTASRKNKLGFFFKVDEGVTGAAQGVGLMFVCDNSGSVDGRAYRVTSSGSYSNFAFDESTTSTFVIRKDETYLYGQVDTSQR